MQKTALCSEKIPAAAADSLSRRGCELVLLPPHPSLPEPVACHADMITAYVDGTLFFDKIYSGAHPEIIRKIKDAGCRVVITEESVGEKYPADCLFNVAIGKSAALGHAAASRDLIKRIADSGREFVAVKQGYAACSSIVAGSALITADEGIAKAAEGFFDVQSIVPGHVRLEPYEYGFIGGASGADGSAVYFVGDLDRHPDAQNIKDHLAANSYKTVSLTDGELIDIGGIKFIN